MATLNIPNTFTNGTPAIATEVNANFNAIKTFAEGISAGTNIDDGSITFAKLDPTVASQLTTSGDGAQVILGTQIFG